MVNGLSVKDQELIRFLQTLQMEVSQMNPKLVSTVINPIKKQLEFLFTTYINVYSLTDQEVDRLFVIMKSSNIGYQTKALVMAKMLRKLDDIENNSLRQSVINKHMFSMNW
jgi:hypothetical protein